MAAYRGEAECRRLPLRIAAVDPKPLLENVGNLQTILAIGRKFAVISGEIDSGPGYQGNQFSDEIQRSKQDMSSAIAIGCFELVAHLAVPGQ